MQTKNQKIVLDIIDMTSDGLGIAKFDNQVFFVKDAILGDKVNAIITKTSKNNNIIYAKKIELIEKSGYRVKPDCIVCEPCGGCQVMSLSYDKQLTLKENIVKNNLKRIAGLNDKDIDEKFLGIMGMGSPYYYRNKIQVPFAKKDGKVITGFYAGRTHHIIENDICVVSFKGSDKIINFVKEYLQNNNSISIYDENTGKGIFRELMIRKANNTEEISVTFIVNDKKKDKKLYMSLVEELIKLDSNIKTITLNINTENNNVIFGKENIVLYGNGYIEDEILGLKFHISPESFYQVNNVQTENLYKTAISFLKDENAIFDNALDLYCGIGTTTLLFSKTVKKITGLEIVEKAIINAKENAKINNIANVDFICANAGDVERFVKDKYDLISVDPPRKGLDIGAIKFIKEQAPKRLLYISCDSATLSRDIKILSDMYDIKKIKCVDMFPHTMHVETACLMERK